MAATAKSGSTIPGTSKATINKPTDAPKPSTSRRDAGDVSDVSEHTSSAVSATGGDSMVERTSFPENIHKRLNALRHLHMETRQREVQLQTATFKLEAEHYRNLEHLYRKRLDIIIGKYEPSAEESKFALSPDANIPTAPDDGQLGVPKFWLVVLNYAAHTADMIHPQDVAALEYLKDIRVEYKDSPLGFTILFEFLPNPYFTNTILSRSFEYGLEMTPTQLYSSSGLMPTKTEGCDVKWKEGKDLTKRGPAGGNVNAKDDKRVDSFFDFFSPAIQDLSQIGQMLTEGDDEDLLEKAEQAGIEYEIATALRTRIVPRALLFYTGEADTEGVEDSDYSGEYSESEDEDGEGMSEEDEASDNETDARKTSKGGR